LVQDGLLSYEVALLIIAKINYGTKKVCTPDDDGEG
jgi:hypothetical protein